MECICEQCGVKFSAIRSTARFCSGVCRAKGSRVSAQNGVEELAHAPKRTITDAVGKAHPIDYEVRRKNYATLKAWAEGKGSEAQRILGQLAMTYNNIKGLDLNSYLGLQC